jgi:peptidoglycan/LPS O-acetylase OafA/YrhL
MSKDFLAHRSTLLDSIRATAVIMVVIFHVATRYPAESLDPIASAFGRYGFLGVDIFFPLSGFLITRFLSSHDGPWAIRSFFLRRFFRIVPLYLVAVTLFWFAAILTGNDRAIIDKIWVTYTFLTGWFTFAWGKDAVPYTITWSLSVEEFAYILFGLLMWVFRRYFTWFLLFFAIAPMILRYLLNVQGHADIYYFPLARLDSIAAGGLVAVLITRLKSLPWWLLGLVVVTFGLWKTSGPISVTMLYSFVTSMTCLVICLFETTLKGKGGQALTLYARIGFYSYFTYLFHFFNIEGLRMVMDRLGIEPMPFWLMAGLCLALTHTQAVLSFRFFEGPIMRYGRRLEKT